MTKSSHLIVPTLHSGVGPQTILLAGVKAPTAMSSRLFSFSRTALEVMWETLHELNAVASHPERFAEGMPIGNYACPDCSDATLQESEPRVKPERAHTLICNVGADTQEALCNELRHMARAIERGELTVGTMGSPSVGSIYSYRVRPEQTHEKYFQEIDAALAREPKQTKEPGQ